MNVAQISQSKVRSKMKPLTFGDLQAGVYKTWGDRKAKGIVHLAVELHLIEFRGAERIVIS
jgi:hypothetical protein